MRMRSLDSLYRLVYDALILKFDDLFDDLGVDFGKYC